MPFGINDKDVIVGYYDAGGINTGFAMLNGKYLSLTVPNSSFTSASGINNAGQIVGVYSDSATSTEHGFVTSPITSADFDAK